MRTEPPTSVPMPTGEPRAMLSWSDDDDKYEFTVYKQDDCDYTWHHIAINEGDRRYLAVQEGSA